MTVFLNISLVQNSLQNICPEKKFLLARKMIFKKCNSSNFVLTYCQGYHFMLISKFSARCQEYHLRKKCLFCRSKLVAFVVVVQQCRCAICSRCYMLRPQKPIASGVVTIRFASKYSCLPNKVSNKIWI